MKKEIASLVLGLGLAIGLKHQIVSALPLQKINDRQEHNFGIDEQLWGNFNSSGDLQSLVTAVDYSLQYLATPKAAKDYRRYSGTKFSLARVRRSLVRFRQLLVLSLIHI